MTSPPAHAAIRERPIDRVTFNLASHGGAHPMHPATDMVICVVFAVSLAALANSYALAKGPLAFLGLSANMFFDLAFFAVMIFGCVEILRLAIRLFRRVARVVRAPRGETGTIAVEFVLIFLPFFLLTGAVVQTSILAHASLVVRYAAFSAARTAIVHTERNAFGLGTEQISTTDFPNGPGDGEEKARSAAAMVLAPLSPMANTQGSSAAQRIEDLRVRMGRPYADLGFSERYRFALDNTTVSFNLVDPEFTNPIPGFNNDLGIPNPIGPRQIEVTVEYPMNLLVPMANWMLSPAFETRSGYRSNYFMIRADCSLQSTGPREMGALPLLIDIIAGALGGGSLGEPSIGRPF